MSLLTGGLGAIATGRLSGDQSAPPKIVLNGLGAWTTQTARYTQFNTPVACFYYEDQSGGGAGLLAPESTYQPGKLQRAVDGTLLLDNIREEGAAIIVSSFRPVYDWGTRWDAPPRVFPAFERRYRKNGDLEYAVMTPEPHSYYNARSVMVYVPEFTFLSPRSLGRFEFLVDQMKELGVNVRLRKDGGKILIEKLSAKRSPGVVWRRQGGVTYTIKLSNKYDMISKQVYSGME